MWCVTWRKTTIAITALAFVASMGAFTLVQKQFFPTANRPELIVDLKLAQGASWKATDKEVRKLEKWLGDNADVAFYTAYIGAGSPRFYLPTVPELTNANFGQVIVMTKDLEARERVFAELDKLFASDFEAVRARVQRLQNGPPVAYPVMFRVLGDDPQQVRAVAERVRQVFKADPATRDVNFDWNELAKTVRLEVDQNKARALGVDSQILGNTLQTLLSGVTVTQYRERTEIDRRGGPRRARRAAERRGAGGDQPAHGNGGVVSLAQLATLHFELEEPILWRRNKELLMTVRAGVIDGVQGPDVAARIDKALAPVRADLPPGYRIEVGGDKEESAKSQGSIFKMMPVMAFLMMLFLMLQLQSFSKLALVVLTGAARPDRRVAVPAGLQPALRLRLAARRDRARRHDHAQLGDPGRPDRPGHRRRPQRLGRRDRRHGAPRPADPAHRRHRHLRHDPAVAQRVLGAHGGRPDGRPAGGDGAHPALPAGALCRVVQGQAAGGEARFGPTRRHIRHWRSRRSSLCWERATPVAQSCS